jgi:hypothetical protein
MGTQPGNTPALLLSSPMIFPKGNNLGVNSDATIIVVQPVHSTAFFTSDLEKQEVDSGWTEHNGTQCPVEPKLDVVIRFRNGREIGPSPASHWRWSSWPDGESEWDIVAWHPVT